MQNVSSCSPSTGSASTNNSFRNPIAGSASSVVRSSGIPSSVSMLDQPAEVRMQDDSMRLVRQHGGRTVADGPTFVEQDASASRVRNMKVDLSDAKRYIIRQPR